MLQPVFDANILYSEMAAVALIVMSIIIKCIQSNNSDMTRHFKALLKFSIAFCAFDAIWGVFASHTLWWDGFTLPYVLSTYIFHIMSITAAYVWFRYTLNYLGEPYSSSRTLKIVAMGGLLLQAALLLTNPMHRLLFVFDENGVYHTCALRKPEFYLQFAYYAAGALFSLIARLYSRTDLNRRHNRTALIYSAVAMAGGVYQMLAPDAPAYSIGFMLSCLSIYLMTMISEHDALLADLQKQREAIYKNAINAEAAGYFEVNLTRDLIIGDIITYEGGREEAVHPEGLPLPLRFSDFIAWWEKVNTAEETDLTEFRRKFDRNYLIECFENGELMQEITYASRSLQGELKYYRQSFFMAREKNTGDIISLCVARDMTKERLKELEHTLALEEARAAAESANRAKSVFLFNMSHDIRTPMNAVLGFTRMALKNIDDREKTRECIQKVESASEHLLNLINKVLDMARIESGKLTLSIADVDVITEFMRVVPIAQSVCDEYGVSFDYEIGAITHRHIRADRLQVNEIILNLLSNAAKYTPRGGHVYYSFSERPCPTAGRAGFRIVVRDDGVGMSEEFLRNIFESFTREKSATLSGVEGTGLGMAIVKQLIDMMGGRIDIHSRPGKGTTVTVDLDFEICTAPAIVQIKDADMTREIDTGAVAARMKGLRVLLVEDNELNREIAMDILEEIGVEAEAAEDGSIAVQKVTAHEPDYYSFVLMDIQMPVMDGYQATREIRVAGDGKYRQLPIIAMTANAFEEDRRKAFAAGMNAHIVKPIKLDVFFRTLDAFV